jgi:small subunit ribosomal protein S16
VAVRIRLMRMGKIRNPQYRIVVADSRTKRDGRAIENLGLYYPKEDPSRIEVNSERVQYWLSVGAQPSDPVRAILRRTGDWQKFKGLTPPSRPVKVAPPKVDRTAIYEAEAKAAAGLSDSGKDDKSGKAEKGDKAEKGTKATKAPAKKAAKKATKQAKPAEPAEPAEAEETAEGAAEPAPAKAEDAAATAASEEQGGADPGEQA